VVNGCRLPDCNEWQAISYGAAKGLINMRHVQGDSKQEIGGR